MGKSFDLVPPRMPNYVTLKMPVKSRAEGFKKPNTIDIVNFTEEEAEEYGELIKQTFIQHYKDRKSKTLTTI